MTKEKTESSHEKFLRLAPARINAALDKIRLIGNLANYQYESTEAKQVIDALFGAVQELKQKLDKTSAQGRSKFTFKDR